MQPREAQPRKAVPCGLVLVAAQVARSGKAALLEQCEVGELESFHSGHFSKGHRATDFGRWATAANVGLRRNGGGVLGGSRAMLL